MSEISVVSSIHSVLQHSMPVWALIQASISRPSLLVITIGFILPINSKHAPCLWEGTWGYSSMAWSWPTLAQAGGDRGTRGTYTSGHTLGPAPNHCVPCLVAAAAMTADAGTCDVMPWPVTPLTWDAHLQQLEPSHLMPAISTADGAATFTADLILWPVIIYCQ